MNEDELEDRGVSLHAGFPNAAVGSHANSLDLTQLLIKHPAATYLMTLDSNKWADQGMAVGDIIIIDRSLRPKKSDTVIWSEHEEFLMSAYNEVPKDIEIWGVVTSVIHQMGRP